MANVKGATITYEECDRILSTIPTEQLWETDDFVYDRHWCGRKKSEDGKYWIGWRPVLQKDGSISEAAQKQWDFVRKSFKFKNVIGSNLKRLNGAILGNEPEFDIIPAKTVNQSMAMTKTDDVPTEKTSEEKYWDEVDEKLVNFWTQKNVHQLLKDFLQAKSAYGKAAILTTIPSGYLEEKQTDGKTVFTLNTTDKKFEDVLDLIHLEVLHFENFIDVPDSEYGTSFVIVRVNPTKEGKNRIAVFYVDTDRRSYFRIVTEGDESDSKISVDLSGNNLCIFAGKYEETLVTDSVKSLQKSVNHAKTGEDYALANINFPQTTFINATEFEEVDAKGNPTGKKQAPMQGLGIVQFLRGIFTETNAGQQITTPTVHERDGADPEKFTRIAETNSEDIDELMGMSYKNAAKSEYTSGRSKERSMDDWDVLKLDSETVVNSVGTKLIENVIRLAFNFTGNVQKNREFNVIFHANISSGEVTNEDKTTMMAEVDKGLRSDESYILNAKVNDNPINEMTRIKNQPQQKPRLVLPEAKTENKPNPQPKPNPKM